MEKTFEQYQKAAEQGYPKAQEKLALYNNNIVEIDNTIIND